MTPIKQTVYLPKATFPLSMKGEVGELFSLQQGYFFTQEQLNEYTANVIKQALETAAENAELTQTPYSDWCTECGRSKDTYINTESITNTFDKIFKKFEV